MLKIQMYFTESVLLCLNKATERTFIACGDCAIDLGELQQSLRIEGVFRHYAELCPAAHEAIVLGRKLFEQIQTSHIQIGAHRVLRVANLHLRHDIYTEHLRLGTRDCTLVTSTGEKAIRP